MMKISLFLLGILCFSFAYGEEEEVLDPEEIGPFLIYNCEKNHWNCVNEARNKECEKLREEDKKKKNTYRYRCAAIEKLPSDRGCFQRQLFYTTKNFGTRFCVKDEWKEKADLTTH